MPAKVQKQPLLADGKFTVKKVIDLNFFDLTGKKAKTRGSSNKSYHAELQLAKRGSQAQIYSMWGPTGGRQNKDWRYYDSVEKAEKDFERIIKSKKKKGYREVEVAQRAYGSEEAKKITAAAIDDVAPAADCSLDPKVQYLVSSLFGNTREWVDDLLKCPLGQLSPDQIKKGRDVLQKAKDINSKKRKTKKDKSKIEEYTNDFYGLIPHNLGSGSRGQLTHLLLDDATKIAQKESDLDTLADAKSVGAVLGKGSQIEAQYKSLNADITPVEDDKLYQWIEQLVLKTRARNHRWLGDIKLLNIWQMKRHNRQKEFLDSVQNIGKKCKGQVIPNMYEGLKVRERKDAFDPDLYQSANVLPLFHGSRTENIIGITKHGLLIRPHNAVLTGAMYGNSVYFGFSTKSMNYTSIRSSYWAKGQDNKGYLFLTDVALGNQLIANGPKQYTKQNIKPKHSVWAKGGQSGVINDEFMIYDTNQSMLRYLIEFTC